MYTDVSKRAGVSRCADVSMQSVGQPIGVDILSDVADGLSSSSHTPFVAEQMELSRQIGSTVATMGEEAAMAEGVAYRVRDVVVV